MGRDQFVSFKKIEDSVDTFLYGFMSAGGDQYAEILRVMKMLLILSHGQAAVERGFSVNKEVEVENIKHRTLVAQRVICDHVKSVGGGIFNVELSKELLMSARMARQMYDQHLKVERQKKKTVGVGEAPILIE